MVSWPQKTGTRSSGHACSVTSPSWVRPRSREEILPTRSAQQLPSSSSSLDSTFLSLAMATDNTCWLKDYSRNLSSPSQLSGVPRLSHPSSQWSVRCPPITTFRHSLMLFGTGSRHWSRSAIKCSASCSSPTALKVWAPLPMPSIYQQSIESASVVRTSTA